jgi:hypothetical protein
VTAGTRDAGGVRGVQRGCARYGERVCSSRTWRAPESAYGACAAYGRRGHVRCVKAEDVCEMRMGARSVCGA